MRTGSHGTPAIRFSPGDGPMKWAEGPASLHWTAFLHLLFFQWEGALRGWLLTLGSIFSVALIESKDQVKGVWAGLHPSVPQVLWGAHWRITIEELIRLLTSLLQIRSGLPLLGKFTGLGFGGNLRISVPKALEIWIYQQLAMWPRSDQDICPFSMMRNYFRLSTCYLLGIVLSAPLVLPMFFFTIPPWQRYSVILQGCLLQKWPAVWFGTQFPFCKIRGWNRMIKKYFSTLIFSWVLSFRRVATNYFLEVGKNQSRGKKRDLNNSKPFSKCR